MTVCYLCEENGEEQACTICCRLICFDTENADDVCAPAAVTASGDLYCVDCARRVDMEEEEEDENEAEWEAEANDEPEEWEAEPDDNDNEAEAWWEAEVGDSE